MGHHAGLLDLNASTGVSSSARLTVKLALLLGTLCAALGACGSATAPHHRHRAPRRQAAKPAPRVTGATSPVTLPQLAGKLVIGVADNDTEFLSDPRFLALRIGFVRDEIPWNALLVPYDRERLATWLDAARRDKLTPLITFDRAAASLRHTLPSVAQFSALFEQFRAQYPWVTEFVTWNEANYYGEPTATHPRRVARYYLALRRDCPTCTVLAPDLLDITNRHYAAGEVAWAHELIHALGFEPPIWALNNYVGANSLDTATTERLLRAVTGDIWFVETAGIITEPNHAAAASEANLLHQASVDRFIVGPLAHLSMRIQRVYLYQWQLGSARDGWDSAL
ncbi:MAG TPA: hypothetical protein VIJ33_05920, partial [Solirubrobacteraceae bacterium]